MSYTERKSLIFSYPECLELIPGDTKPNLGREYLLDFMTRHNATVRSYATAISTVKPKERAILDLGRGIASWLNFSEYGDDGLLGREVTVPLLQAFRAALNGDIGQLDAGTLDSWACDTATHYGLDLDTGEFISD